MRAPSPPRLARDRRGVASVEFAAVGVALVLLIQLVLETGWQAATEMALEHGAHDALRFAITGNAGIAGVSGAPACRAATIVFLVTHGAAAILQANNLQVSSSQGGQAAVASSAAGFGGVASQTVTYTFLYTQPWITPFARIASGATTYTHRISMVAQNEPYPTQPC